MTCKMFTTLLPLFLMLLLLPGCDNAEAVSLQVDDAGTPAVSAADRTEPSSEAIIDAEALGIAPQPNSAARTTESLDEPKLPATYVVVQNAAPRDPARLVYLLQQVLRKTQVVKQVQSPNPREIKLEVSNIRDVRALANKIPFASVEKIDMPSRTITVDFEG